MTVGPCPREHGKLRDGDSKQESQERHFGGKLLRVSPTNPTYIMYINCSNNTFDSFSNSFLKQASPPIFQPEFLKSLTKHQLSEKVFFHQNGISELFFFYLFNFGSVPEGSLKITLINKLKASCPNDIFDYTQSFSIL